MTTEVGHDTRVICVMHMVSGAFIAEIQGQTYHNLVKLIGH